MSTGPDDPPPEAALAVPLADAFRDHADRKLVEQYRLTKEQLDRGGKWQYVGTPREIKGYVLSEFDAHGHRLLKESRALLAQIEVAFLTKLRQGNLTAWAREGSPLAPWREIPASAWSILQIDELAKGTTKGPGATLFDVRVGARTIRHDPARNSGEVPPVMRTGTQGRPKKGIHFIMAEFEHRRDAGSTEPSRMREAEWLLAWFRTHHSDKEPPTVKTIYNNLPAGFFAPVVK